MMDLYMGSKDGIDLCVYHCGMEQCVPGHYYGPAIRDHYLIHFIHSGKGKFHIDGKIYNLEKNQGFLICPDIITYYEADSVDPWTYSWVGFQGIKAEKLLKYAGLSRDNPIFTYDKSNFVRECFRQMMIATKLKRGNEIRLLGNLYLFLSELIENANYDITANKNQRDLYINKAIKYIEMNYSRKITISDIAKYVSLDRSYFSTIFKNSLNTSPQEFLINYRLNKACELMKNPALSISDVSRSVGYEDPLAFSKIFKKIKGYSPMFYRKMLT
ncbi:MAG: AraC family transcriptional regulator [Thermoanaerobacterium sp.]|nr:AraC family transcriptional regulator [Thermoanaerobacterium sp.]